jgi:hypothetical protein
LPALDDALRHRLRAGAYHLRPRRRNATPCTFIADS